MPTVAVSNSFRPVNTAPTSTPVNPQPAEPEDAMIANYRSDIGPLVNDRLNGVVSEFGPGAISKKNLRDRTFSFAEDTAFGIRIEERAYSAKDPYVQECPVRKKVADDLKQKSGGHEVAFVESAGLTEIQGGFINTMPLVSSAFGGIAMNYGFTANALLRYRASIPQVLGFGERPETNFKNQKVSFYPMNADKALQMSPGSEYEIAGKARLLVNTVVAARVGLGIDHATAGGGIFVNGTTTAEKETSLNVLALDRAGMVRVTIRHLDEETAQILTRIRSGVIFGVGALAPNLIGGFLRYYVERLGAPNVEELANSYTTLYATFSARTAHRGVAIGSWDLDLTKPEGREAYESLLRLNTVSAEELAHSGHAAVTDLHFKENEGEFRFYADVGAIGLKYFIYESLRNEREGRLNGPHGKTKIYHDALYTRRKKTIFGPKEITWEAVSIDDGERHGKEPFLRIHFENKDWDFGTDSVDRMLRFAKALQIPQGEIVGNQTLFERARIDLTKRAEVQVSSDVYFTSSGVDLIDNADAKQGKDAYLKVAATLHKHLNGTDFSSQDPSTKDALRRIDEYRNMLLWDRLKVATALEEDYQEFTGRNLRKDIKLVKEAETFGAAVDRMHKSTRSKAEIEAFMQLAEKQGFDYMMTVGALAALAGPKETLVHALSISSGGIVIKSVAQPAIEGPREEVVNELYRVADPQVTDPA